LKAGWELANDSEIFDIENTGKASQEEFEFESEDSMETERPVPSTRSTSTIGPGEGLLLADVVVALGGEETEEDGWKILHHFQPTLLLLPLSLGLFKNTFL
jgi:hypothetical protein